MAYGRKPPHRSGEKEFKGYLKRFPPSLRENYIRIHRAIKEMGGRQIEWYHLRDGESRYRTKDKPGLQRGRIFAWIKIYHGWLCVFLPEHDSQFFRKNAGLFDELTYEYADNYWYGKGQIEIDLDVGDPEVKRHVALVLKLLKKALMSVS